MKTIIRATLEEVLAVCTASSAVLEAGAAADAKLRVDNKHQGVFFMSAIPSSADDYWMALDENSFDTFRTLMQSKLFKDAKTRFWELLVLSYCWKLAAAAAAEPLGE